MTTKQNLLVANSIKIVRFTFTCNKAVKFINHETESVEFVLELGTMYQDDTLKQETTDINIGHLLSDTIKHSSKARSKVSQTLFLRVKA
jgi:hypothetical protein